MSWAQDAARSLADALGGAPGGPLGGAPGGPLGGAPGGPLGGAPGGASGADGVVIAIAAVDAAGTAAVTSPADTPADGRFEIGSVTKTMTATVLASLAAEGVLELDDQIGRWLAAGPNGGITIRQLATHTSGLPALAANRQARSADPANPWAGYTFELAEEGLRETAVTPGHPWRYSNLGYQLLGLILERASGLDYPALTTRRLLTPLSMTHSGVGSHGSGTLLPGHAHGRPVPRWDHPWGAGGVEATIGDMARYAGACLVPPRTPLGAAIALAQRPVLRVSDDTEQALAWAVRDGPREHSGGTGGFSACLTVDRGRGRSVAALVSDAGSPARSTLLKQAAQLVLAGKDPRHAAAPRPRPGWRDDARAIVRALLDGRVAQVHARLIPQRRERVTVQQLERACAGRLRGVGPQADFSIVHHEIAASGAVLADVEISVPAGPQRLRMVILRTGDLGGLSFLPTADRAAD